MTKIKNFLNGKAGVWASIEMSSSEPCYISIAQSGIIVKKSKLGILGAKIYSETKVPNIVQTAQLLDQIFPNKITPSKMTHPVLIAFTNTVLHCNNLAETAAVLNNPQEYIQHVKNIDNRVPTTSSGNNDEVSFKDKILEISHKCHIEEGYEPNSDLQTASIMTVVEIMGKLHAEKAIVPIEGGMKTNQATISSTMMCVVSNNICNLLRNEGADLNLLEVIVGAGKAVYQLLEDQLIEAIIKKGFENYQSIINAMDSMENIDKFTRDMGKTTYMYVMSSGEFPNSELQEKTILIYSKLFDGLEKTFE
jgi:hypothetical protein